MFVKFILLANLLVTTSLADLSAFSYPGQDAGADPCHPTPCGPNTRCTINRNSIGVCRCLDGFFPKPNTIVGCGPQCVTDAECGSARFACIGQKCVNPCVKSSPCGLNALCDVRNHQAACSCPPGYQGSPYSSCTLSQLAVRSGSHSQHRTPAGPPTAVRASTYVDTEIQARGPPSPPPVTSSACSPSPCGTNARCDAVTGRAVCSCPPAHQGDPLRYCRRGDCSHDSECAAHKACLDLTCQNPCTAGVCGVSADCTVENHRAICSCPKNHIGDPFTSCRFDPATLCTPSPCGHNTDCRVKNERPVCSCRSNYIGDPLTGCRPECEHDQDCAASQHCLQNRCKNACTGACGRNARCEAVQHRAVCKCPQYYQGNGVTGCYPECTAHSDCPGHHACLDLRCQDPCVGACGTGAECRATQHKAICKCPKGYEGHPFTSCYPAPPRDPCVPNPCGTSADCRHGSDRSGSSRPVCTCPAGYLGDPLVSCRRGECQDSSECSASRACYQYHCVDPCVGSAGNSVCGTNAQCRAQAHKAVCSCPREYTGDPLTECRLKPLARSNTGRLLR